METQRYEYTKLQRAKAVPGTPDGGASGGMKNSSFFDATTDHLAPYSRPVNPRLTEDRLRRLEAIGFQWKVKNKMQRYYQKQWDNMFDRLKAFKEINGHVNVPKRYPADIRLGTWVSCCTLKFRLIWSLLLRFSQCAATCMFLDSNREFKLIAAKGSHGKLNRSEFLTMEFSANKRFCHRL